MEVVNVVRPLDPAVLDNAVQLYVAGKSLTKAAAEAGIGTSSLMRELGKRGIKSRGPRKKLPDTEIVQKYRDGVSELRLAREYGVERAVIRLRLEEAGVQIRGQSEAIGLFYASTTREQRAQITAAANAATRGVSQPEDRLERIAASRAAKPKPMSRHEKQFAAWITERDISYTREVAVGRYNLDFALGPVAVEILGGEWHGTQVKTRIHGRRTPYILDQRWAIVFCWATPSHPMTEAVAEYVVAFVDEVRRDPTLVGEYRVVRGDGHLLARGRKEDYERTGITPARYS